MKKSDQTCKTYLTGAQQDLVLDSQGQDPQVITYVLGDARDLGYCQRNFKKQVVALRAFHAQYMSDAWKVLWEQPEVDVRSKMDDFKAAIETFATNTELDLEEMNNVCQNLVQLVFFLLSAEFAPFLIWKSRNSV